MTTAEAFANFKSDLELPDAKQKEAAKAQQDVRANVAKQTYVEGSFLTGSYSRYTKVNPLSDIDVFIVKNAARVSVNTSGAGVKPAQALSELHNAVKKAYPTAKTSVQSRSVNLELHGLSFGFDLIPAWYRNPDGFWIPDGDLDVWMPTHPEWHGDTMTAANDAISGKLKPLIKMAKHWSRNNYDRLRSFHIELICKAILKEEPGSWSLGMATVLAYLPDYIGKQMMDPAYGQTRVDKPLSTTELAELTSRVNYDANNAIEALHLEGAGRHEEAIAKWRDIFLHGF